MRVGAGSAQHNGIRSDKPGACTDGGWLGFCDAVARLNRTHQPRHERLDCGSVRIAPLVPKRCRMYQAR